MNENPDLLPPPWREMPAGRHEFLKKRLMSAIDEDGRAARTVSTRRRSFLMRPAFALPALILVIATGVGIAGIRHDGGDQSAAGTVPAQFADPHAGNPHGVAQLTNRMALVAATREDKPAATGDWVYVSSKNYEFFIAEDDDAHTRTPVARVSERQTWTAVDGSKGWLIQSGIGQAAGGETLGGNGGKADLNAPTYNLLAGLPTDPAKLLAKIYAENTTVGNGIGPDSAAFTTIGDLLGESYPPNALYPAIYRAAARIPGVLVVDDAVDAAGRHGVALARVDESGLREELIFDSSDYTFLGTREVRTNDADGIKAGTVVYSSAIVKRALVGAMKQIPAN